LSMIALKCFIVVHKNLYHIRKNLKSLNFINIDMANEIKQKVQKLRKDADSSNWHLREVAGFTLRDLLEDNFEEIYPLIKSWCTDPSENVRRAACLACMQRKAKTTPPRVRAVLKYQDVIMKDDSLYVRKCCGPFVLGYLGYTYPAITLPWLAKKAKQKDLNVRANVAKAFSQGLGRNFYKEGIKILEILADDGRPRVISAVKSAAKNILKLNPNAQLKPKTYALLAKK
jgi:hypothetical protein